MQLFLGMAVLAFACAAEAQQPVVYPAKGQSMQQQSQNEAQCSAWAKQSTGIDPAVVGTMAGGRQARQQQDAQHQQAQAQQQQQIQTYDRAYDACMVGRGYTSK
jgi:hypothetical protein